MTRIEVVNRCPHKYTDECGNPICHECNGAWGHERECSHASRGSEGTYPCPGGSRRVLAEGEYVLFEKVDRGWIGVSDLLRRYNEILSEDTQVSLGEVLSMERALDDLAGGES